MDVFWSAPPVIRAITAATFVESLLVYSHLLGATKVIFHHSFIFKIFPEVWRLVTPFFLTDRDLNFIFDLYFMYKYGSGLERDSPRFTVPGDFFTYVIFVGTVIVPYNLAEAVPGREEDYPYISCSPVIRKTYYLWAACGVGMVGLSDA
ncbi:derlin-2/3 [[Emmonsia] crescens]|uniref:Derlin n=1 Tax=[Emmonsia] crescens TaxID=73230 RepID=A0A2B7Z6E9_9EURO|nr:derlin-2/3 [Emmonsia crescens]